MNKIIQSIKQFLNDEEGVTAIEYGLIAALIGIVIMVPVGLAGTSLSTLFGTVATTLAG